MTFDLWHKEVLLRTEVALEQFLPAETHIPSRLHQAMRYACLNGGKRMRPVLVHAAGAVSGATPDTLDYCAAAIEMIHVYSLVHDDMPCMDDDVLRRGQPTCHVRYDEPTALLVGDALQTLAFQILTQTPVATATQISLIRTLAEASGSTGMAGGQAIDLASVGIALNAAELEQMHIMKTGALIRAAIRLGALAGESLSPSELESLDHLGKRLGLLFQVVDDILDCTSSTAELGKTAGKDVAADKPTYVSLMGLSGARSFADDLHTEAQSLASSLGPAGQRLGDIARQICQRTH